jgi:hypothetical protein
MNRPNLTSSAAEEQGKQGTSHIRDQTAHPEHPVRFVAADVQDGKQIKDTHSSSV